jgi:hypothetical protein
VRRGGRCEFLNRQPGAHSLRQNNTLANSGQHLLADIFQRRRQIAAQVRVHQNAGRHKTNAGLLRPALGAGFQGEVQRFLQRV